MTNEQIAERLVLGPATGRTHVDRLFSKVGARHRAQLVGALKPPVQSGTVDLGC